MELSRLAKSLEAYHPQLIVQNPETARVQDAEIYDGAADIIEPGILYILESPSLSEKLSAEMQRAAFFCVSAKLWENAAVREQLKGNVLVLENPPKASKLCSLMLNVLSEGDSYTRDLAVLNRMLCVDCEITQILETGAALLCNPLVLKDFFTDSMQFSGQDADMKRYPAQLTIRLKVRSTVIGELYVLGRQSLRKRDYGICTLLGKILSSKLELSSIYQNGAYEQENVRILELLSGQSAKSGTDRRPMKGELHIVLVMSGEYRPPFILEQIRLQMEKELTDCKSVIYNQSVICILNCAFGRSLSEEVLVFVRRITAEKNLRCGVSRSFSMLEDLRIFYLQAQKALELGRCFQRDEKLFFYEEYAFYHMLEFCAQRQELMDFCHPDLWKLISCDRLNHTDYARSFSVFLNSGRSPKSASETLHITPAALAYRLSKIQKLLSGDLQDPDYLWAMRLSFQILDFCRHVGEETREI